MSPRVNFEKKEEGGGEATCCQGELRGKGRQEMYGVWYISCSFFIIIIFCHQKATSLTNVHIVHSYYIHSLFLHLYVGLVQYTTC